jgi:microtubule-associated protein-like 6
MGQTLGRAPLLPGPRNFSNLPRSKIFELWGSFHEQAEGFGLTQDEFLEILRSCLSTHLEFSAKKLDQIGKVVFTTLDDDANDLIDALEFLSSFAVMSGMTPKEKAQFVFGMFDFDECGLLTCDELSFALRTTIGGLCKLSAMDAPLESDIDRVAFQATISRSANQIQGHGKIASHISLHDFITFCDICPEVASWMCCFGDLDEFGVPTLKIEDTDEKCTQFVAHGGRTLYRSGRAFAAMDIDSGGGACMGIEERGYAKDICAQPPWRTDVVPYTEPSDCPVAIPDMAPDIHLQLEWVHGMNTKQSKGSVTYTGEGDLVYPAGCLGIVTDLESGTQRYLNSHTDTITCLKVYIEGDEENKGSKQGMNNGTTTLIATGEAGKVPKVIVWTPGSRIEEPRVVTTLKGFHKEGISQVAWSPNGALLVSVGGSGVHCVAVYDWRRRALLFAAPSCEYAVLGATWASNDRFVTCGYNHINFWSCEALRDSKTDLSTKTELYFGRERGLFGKKSLNMPLLCVGGFGSVVVTGGATGHLNVWDGRNCIRTAKGHSGAITCLYVLSDHGDLEHPRGLVTGGSEGNIQLWNHQLELGQRFDGYKLLHPSSSTIHSVVWDDFNHKILVSFWSCEIYEVHDAEGYDIHD